jgi:hypothetical protein
MSDWNVDVDNLDKVEDLLIQIRDLLQELVDKKENETPETIQPAS